MTLYTYNKEKLAFKEINTLKWGLFAALVFILMLGLIIFSPKDKKTQKVYVESEQSVVLKTKNEFSKEKLVKLIKDLHIKHPEIVYTQFVFESGHFESTLFKTQNNLMGMRIATTRPTTAVGENGGYAVYKDWSSCVVDYALYQSSFLRGVDKEDYYQYLGESYAKNPSYIKEIKNYIKENNVKELFK